MRKIALPSTAILGAMLALSLPAAPAQALSTKTWVASNGTNNATCDRATPCDTFQHAYDATTAKGEINCVDAADYGTLNISKSISIVCDNTQASINSLTTTVIINAAATDVVTLRGLDLDGNGTANNGIFLGTVGVVHVHNVRIRGFAFAGIFLGTSNYTELYVADSHITECGSDASRGGILIQQGGSGSANVFVNRVRLENNSNGILAVGSVSTGVAANVSVIDSIVSGSAFNGIAALTSAGKQAVSIFVDHCVVSGNFASGINVDAPAASGPGSALVRIGDSSIALNVNGVSAANLGVLQSFKNNRISSNLSDGTPIAAYPGPGGTALQ